MNHPTLMLHLDESSACPDRTSLAMELARRFSCHLTGLTAAGTLPFSAAAGPALGGADRIASTVSHMIERAARRGEAFEARCRACGLVSFDTTQAEDDDASALVRASHASDLMVLSQGQDDESHRLVEDVVLKSARPVLVVPPVPRPEAWGRHILVAWDSSRACARAVADALPFLRQAEQVRLLGCETALDEGHAIHAADLAEVAAWLKRHGIQAAHGIELTEIDVGNALLSRTADWDIDLLVMGAYGHTRWSERILGGVTRTVLKTMTVPVLMSH
jgi:nucleotide-binding universal stress UspA family protein